MHPPNLLITLPWLVVASANSKWRGGAWVGVMVVWGIGCVRRGLQIKSYMCLYETANSLPAQSVGT